jgi:hypothetical protein
MVGLTEKIMTACGREVGKKEIVHIQNVVELCSGLSRRELALTVCEHWNWVGATGKPLVRACTKLLEKLERQGAIQLPEKRGSGRRKQQSCKKIVMSTRSMPQATIENKLATIQPVRLERVVDEDEKGLWNEFVACYHRLGFKQPFGCSLRYFITSPIGRLGCFLLSSAARALRCRDEWIGWSTKDRLRNLPWVINNSRFLLFPWVHIPHLASHVLGQLARRVLDDWEACWGYRPVLMETFVDPQQQHQGVCYRAAGWLAIGQTTGQGLRIRGHSYHTSPKIVLVRPLTRDFRTRLCSHND